MPSELSLLSPLTEAVAAAFHLNFDLGGLYDNIRVCLRNALCELCLYFTVSLPQHLHPFITIYGHCVLTAGYFLLFSLFMIQF